MISNMDGPRDNHTKSEVSHTEKDKYRDITYMWNLKKMIQMNLFTKQKQIYRLRKLMVTKGEVGKG